MKNQGQKSIWWLKSQQYRMEKVSKHTIESVIKRRARIKTYDAVDRKFVQKSIRNQFSIVFFCCGPKKNVFKFLDFDSISCDGSAEQNKRGVRANDNKTPYSVQYDRMS